MKEKTEYSKDDDIITAGTVSAEELTKEEDKRLLRRIDLYILPVMAVSYMFQFLDKSALGFTAIMGLREDLKLTGEGFSWASSIYYFGYLIASYPAAMVMVRWRVGKTIAIAVVFWGVVLMLTAVTTNAAGLFAVRFFLGVCEAPIAPGLTVIVAMWYKRSEQPLRHAAWFLGNTTAGILGGLMAYGIGHIQTIATWKAVFLIFGGATVAWSIGVFFLLPDVPMTAYFLSEEDRTKAVTRVKENMTGIKNNTFKWSQCREALVDPKTWFIVLIQSCGNIPNGGVHSFGSIVIEEGLGFDTLPTLLLTSASYLAQLILVLLSTGGSTYFRNVRSYFMMFNFALATIGACLVRQLPAEQRWARYVGYCLILAFSANFPMVMSLTSGNFGGFTKKMTVNAISFMVYCAGNIIGPQLFLAKEAPTYTSGFLAMMVCFGVGVVLCALLRVYLARENRRRDGLSVGGHVEAETVDAELMANLMDKTDMEIPQFRQPAMSSSSASPPSSLAHLLPASWKTQVTAWLAEDTPTFDYVGYVVGEAPRTATLWAKSAGVVAGRPFFDEVFAQCGCAVEWHVDEGADVDPGADGKVKAATVTGPARCILLGERVALNTLARCSGIAARSRSLLTRLRAAGYSGILAGTRKTTPGFRLVEKYGMQVAGVDPHRMDLSAMPMIKDNAVWSRGSITEAVRAAKRVAGFSLKIEVEVQSEQEADEAIEAGADIVMLDNFTGDGVKIAARSLKERWQGKRHFLVEVSGGLRDDNVEAYVCNDIDVISTSYIHQGVGIVDYSLKIEH
ncbi:calcium-transporting ATPase 3 [Purpureocillium lavendulum]|uniref:Nicotinate-nucleotide pyrophosphorylase [carboxylating] n=1 Tax=Purpureocillium lavendulum TaxID=1247861 RepID=A0AB34G9T4_9HYPO|nr:calcium-transporting ATPase 3 [Purpureocillium lavendulum]